MAALSSPPIAAATEGFAAPAEPPPPPVAPPARVAVGDRGASRQRGATAKAAFGRSAQPHKVDFRAASTSTAASRARRVAESPDWNKKEERHHIGEQSFEQPDRTMSAIGG